MAGKKKYGDRRGLIVRLDPETYKDFSLYCLINNVTLQVALEKLIVQEITRTGFKGASALMAAQAVASGPGPEAKPRRNLSKPMTAKGVRSDRKK